MGSEAFAVRVKTWIDFWVAHASTKGIKPEQLFLLLLDEPSKSDQDRIIIAWAKAIRTAQPKVIWIAEKVRLEAWKPSWRLNETAVLIPTGLIIMQIENLFDIMHEQ